VLKRKGIPIQKVYLFGSQAKGTARIDSDIDLLVVSPAFSGMPLWERWEVLGDALAEVLEPIEVILRKNLRPGGSLVSTDAWGMP